LKPFILLLFTGAVVCWLFFFFKVRIQYAIDRGDTTNPLNKANDNNVCNIGSDGREFEVSMIRAAESTPR